MEAFIIALFSFVCGVYSFMYMRTRQYRLENAHENYKEEIPAWIRALDYLIPFAWFYLGIKNPIFTLVGIAAIYLLDKYLMSTEVALLPTPDNIEWKL